MQPSWWLNYFSNLECPTIPVGQEFSNEIDAGPQVSKSTSIPNAASGRLYAACLPLLHDNTRDCVTCLRARCITMSALFHFVTQVGALVSEGAYRTGVVLRIVCAMRRSQVTCQTKRQCKHMRGNVTSLLKMRMYLVVTTQPLLENVHSVSSVFSRSWFAFHFLLRAHQGGFKGKI